MTVTSRCRSWSLPGGPWDIACSVADATLIVVERLRPALVVLDPATGRTEHVALRRPPAAVALRADRAFVVGPFGDLVVVDLERRVVAREVPVAPLATDVATLPATVEGDGCVVVSASGVLARVCGDGLRSGPPISLVGPAISVSTAVADRVWVGGRGYASLVVDEEVVATVPLADGPVSVAAEQDGGAWAALHRSGELVRLDAAGQIEERARVATGLWAIELAQTTVVVSALHVGGIVTLDRASGVVRERTCLDHPWAIASSDDRLLVARAHRGDVVELTKARDTATPPSGRSSTPPPHLDDE